ncbi:MAG: ATP-dependent DNA helicase RecG [Flavobacteriales bacterium]|nr:ATP-dependent DNA helicase RecG [Flavobacteriales bacterium]
MAESFLNTPIEFLKGVGPQRAQVLREEIAVFTFGDLLYHLPFRYEDRSVYHTIRDVRSEAGAVQIKGKLLSLTEVGKPRQKRLVGRFEDDTGEIELIWFKGAQWVRSGLEVGKEYIVFGKPNLYRGTWSIAHPEMDTPQGLKSRGGLSLIPVYPSTEKLGKRGLNSNGIHKLVGQLLADPAFDVPDYLPGYLLKALRIPGRKEAIRQMHFPTEGTHLANASKRLKFEELFLVQLQLIRNRDATTKRIQGPEFTDVGEHFTRFYEEHLPFELTGAQKRVIKEIRKDMKHGTHMNRLLQGDVGSGKTVVALLSALIAIDNGYQVCIMAPTEILAQQHYRTFSAMLENMPLEVRLLTGSTKTAQRKEIHYALEAGTLHILVGTHALIEPKVKFHRLGLAIIDEQHRFGVKQRSKLWRKAMVPPHVLVMTATPIPRTLAMTLYGDLDVSVIDQLPPGRKPVDTRHYRESSRMKVFGFVEEQVELGRQVYIVYPLIEESENFDYKDLMDGYESVTRRFPLPKYRVSIVHGKMKPEDKDHEMQLFSSGQNQIMVSTTVIEVGVDVPNASVMIIESAEKFGLSQLHQLRGRVGRGAEKSFCILMTGDKLSRDARTRLETMCRTNDGFEVAEVDLALRGPGDLMGTQQSGVVDLKVANLTKDQDLLQVARHMAEQVIGTDPDLETAEHTPLRLELERLAKDRANWGLIS